MREPQRPGWRAILFAECFRIEWPGLELWWARRRERKKILAQTSAGFDLRWMRWLVTLAVPLTAATLLFLHKDPAWEAAIGTGVFAVGLCLYFAWLLFARLQCSLLELIVLVAFLGNAEGLILATPNLAGLAPASWVLAPLVAGWVFYGMVVTLVQAKILALEKPVPRLLLLACNWFVLAAPALCVAGVFLTYARFAPQDMKLVGRGMAAWGLPLLATGVVGLLMSFWLERKTRRAARRILGVR
ncbi:MAG: hypothetical protein ABSE73_21935 [Planctomycetota bacterium]